jgi:hypothetical protein
MANTTITIHRGSTGFTSHIQPSATMPLSLLKPIGTTISLIHGVSAYTVEEVPDSLIPQPTLCTTPDIMEVDTSLISQTHITGDMNLTTIITGMLRLW